MYRSNNFFSAVPEIVALERLCDELKAEKEKSTDAQLALVKAISDLQRSSENSKRELEAVAANLKHDLDVERKKVAEITLALQDTLLDRSESDELAESFRQKLLALKDKKDLNEASLKKEKINLEKQLLEREEILNQTIEELHTIEGKFLQSHKISFKALSDLKSSSENDTRELKGTIINLKKELDAEKKQTSELVVFLQELTKEKNDANERSQSLQLKLSVMEKEAELNHNVHEEEKQSLQKQLQDCSVIAEEFSAKLEVRNNPPRQVQTQAIIPGSSDNVQIQMEATVANLKLELEVEKQRTSLMTVSVQALTLARNEANKLADSLQCKLLHLETQVKHMAKAEEKLEAHAKECKSVLADNRQRFEKEKQDLLRQQVVMASQKSKLTLDIQTLSLSYSKLTEECNTAKKETFQIMAQLEEVQRENESLRSKVDPPVVDLSD